MTADQIPQLFRFGNDPFESFFAADERFDRQQVRETAVMAGFVPTDQLKLCVFDALPVKFLHNGNHLIESQSDLDRRLILLGLFRNGGWNRLPAETDAYQRSLQTLFQNRLGSEAVFQVFACSAFQLIFAVTACHTGVITLIFTQFDKIDKHIFIGKFIVKETDDQLVKTIFQTDDDIERQFHAFHNAQPAAVAAIQTVNGHCTAGNGRFEIGAFVETGQRRTAGCSRLGHGIRQQVIAL